MPAPDIKTPASFLFWTLGVVALGTFARVGWELGGLVWGLL